MMDILIMIIAILLVIIVLAIVAVCETLERIEISADCILENFKRYVESRKEPKQEIMKLYADNELYCIIKDGKVYERKGGKNKKRNAKTNKATTKRTNGRRKK